MNNEAKKRSVDHSTLIKMASISSISDNKSSSNAPKRAVQPKPRRTKILLLKSVTVYIVATHSFLE